MARDDYRALKTYEARKQEVLRRAEQVGIPSARELFEVMPKNIRRKFCEECPDVASRLNGKYSKI